MGKPKDPEYFKRYYQRHRTDLIDYVKVNYKHHKLEVYRLLGNCCSCCGLSEISCLQIDHVNNDGAEHRKQLNGGDKIYRYILTHYDTEKDRFQLLCANCHSSKTQLGQCYHKIF